MLDNAPLSIYNALSDLETLYRDRNNQGKIIIILTIIIINIFLYIEFDSYIY